MRVYINAYVVNLSFAMFRLERKSVHPIMHRRSRTIPAQKRKPRYLSISKPPAKSQAHFTWEYISNYLNLKYPVDIHKWITRTSLSSRIHTCSRVYISRKYTIWTLFGKLPETLQQYIIRLSLT